MLQLVQQPVEVPAGLQQELALVLPCHRKALGQRAEERWRSYGCFDEALPQFRRQMNETRRLNLSQQYFKHQQKSRGASELGSAVAQACAALNTNLRNLSF